MVQNNNSRSTRRRRIFWIVLIILILGGLAWYFRPSEASHNGGRKGMAAVATPVVAATATKGDIDVTRDALGTVTPVANVVVRTQINGVLQQIGFEEGQLVTAGDFLAQV